MGKDSENRLSVDNPDSVETSPIGDLYSAGMSARTTAGASLRSRRYAQR